MENLILILEDRLPEFLVERENTDLLPFMFSLVVEQGHCRTNPINHKEP